MMDGYHVQEQLEILALMETQARRAQQVNLDYWVLLGHKEIRDLLELHHQE